MNTHKVCLNGEIRKIIPKLSSNTCLINFSNLSSLLNHLFFSSPEPKATGPLSVRPRPSLSSTLSNLNISEASWPILITFYV